MEGNQASKDSALWNPHLSTLAPKTFLGKSERLDIFFSRSLENTLRGDYLLFILTHAEVPVSLWDLKFCWNTALKAWQNEKPQCHYADQLKYKNKAWTKYFSIQHTSKIRLKNIPLKAAAKSALPAPLLPRLQESMVEKRNPAFPVYCATDGDTRFHASTFPSISDLAITLYSCKHKT